MEFSKILKNIDNINDAELLRYIIRKLKCETYKLTRNPLDDFEIVFPELSKEFKIVEAGDIHCTIPVVYATELNKKWKVR